MEFLYRASGVPGRLGVLPGSFNPVTVAHLELARAGLGAVDEVVFVLPRVFPHKTFSGASFSERMTMLRLATAGEPSFSIATAGKGLFVEIAAECRAAYGAEARLTFLCGRDAAERIAGWDYGDPEAFPAMLREFDLLVANRSGEYVPPSCWSASIETVRLPAHVEVISATEVRERIALGLDWEHLVPEPVRAQALRIYSATGPAPPEISPRY